MTRDTPPKSSILDGVPIVGVTGVNGAGKTLLAVQKVLRDLGAGRTVYSTTPVRASYGETQPILGLSHLLELHSATVFLDEISATFSARAHASLPAEGRLFLQTLRKRGITLLWTAPNWVDTDAVIRRVTQAVATVRPLFRRAVPGSPWPRAIVSAVGLLDCISVKVDAEPDKVLRRRFIVPSMMHSFGAYDTDHIPPVWGERVADGPCPDCGGTRTRPKCDDVRHELLGLPAPRRGLLGAVSLPEFGE